MNSFAAAAESKTEIINNIINGQSPSDSARELWQLLEHQQQLVSDLKDLSKQTRKSKCSQNLQLIKKLNNMSFLAINRYQAFKQAHDEGITLIHQTKLTILKGVSDLLYFTSLSDIDSCNNNDKEKLIALLTNLNQSLALLIDKNIGVPAFKDSFILSEKLESIKRPLSIRIAAQIPYELLLEYAFNFSIIKKVTNSFRVAANTISKTNLHFLTSGFTFGFELKKINNYDGSKSFYVTLKKSLQDQQFPKEGDQWEIAIENVMTLLYSRENVDVYLQLLKIIETHNKTKKELILNSLN
jgi:hypothetical protein